MNLRIGDRIKQRRIELGMDADELAKKTGKSRATIYRYENGDIENLPITVLEPIANALLTTPASLMGWEDNLNKSSADLMVDMIYDTELLEHVHKINKLSSDDKKTIYDMIDFLFEKAGL